MKEMIEKKWRRLNEHLRMELSSSEYALIYPRLRDQMSEEMWRPTMSKAYEPVSIYTTHGKLTYYPKEDRIERDRSLPIMEYPDPRRPDISYLMAQQDGIDAAVRYMAGTDLCKKEEELTNKLLLLCH